MFYMLVTHLGKNGSTELYQQRTTPTPTTMMELEELGERFLTAGVIASYHIVQHVSTKTTNTEK